MGRAGGAALTMNDARRGCFGSPTVKVTGIVCSDDDDGDDDDDDGDNGDNGGSD